MSRDDFTVICWPDIQQFMDVEGFRDNTHLINDDTLYEEYGDSAYFVRKQWLYLTGHKKWIT